MGQAIGFVTYMFIPRGLGPSAYGNFNFLNNFFTQVMGFLELGTSSAFYTKISHRQDEPGLVSFYARFTCLISLAALIVASFSFFGWPRHIFWPGQQTNYIFLAAGLVIVVWCAELLGNMTDAYGLTVYSEMAKIAQKAFGLIIIPALYFMGILKLGSFFLYQYAIFVVLVISLLWILAKDGRIFAGKWHLTSKQINTYSAEFYKFSHPLVVYGLVGMVVSLFDRWLLQIYGGSIQQGFFGIAYQIGAICFLFSGAMTPLLLREFSISFGNNNIKHMAKLFMRYIPLLYSITAYISCFVVVQAGNVIHIIGGDRFRDAAIALAVMSLYPIHRTYGQLSGSVFFATGQTRLYTNTGIVTMLAGIPLTYFCIMPSSAGGIAAGATGLAAKMVILQFAEVNLRLFFVSKFMGLSFGRQLLHQLGIVAVLLFIAVVGMRIAGLVVHNVTVGFFVSGIVYTALAGVIAYIFPRFFGLKREDITSAITRLYWCAHSKEG